MLADLNIDKEKTKFFAQKSSSEDFKYFVTEYRLRILELKLLEIMNIVIPNTIFSGAMKILETTYTMSTNKQVPNLVKLLNKLPLLEAAVKASGFLYYCGFEADNFRDEFTDELIKYRCCHENNHEKTECIGNTADAEICIDYL